MGDDNSKTYNRNEKIFNEENKSARLEKDIDKMWSDPRFSFEECVHANIAKNIMDDKIKSLKRLNEKENNFTKNIDLNKYRNDDGTFTIYKTSRPLNSSNGEQLYEMSKKLHHEGMAIGNGKNLIYSDYGVNENNSSVRFWDSNENKENWADTKIVGKTNASDNEVKEIFFGEKSEKWEDPKDYNFVFHNCQDYAKEKINDFKRK